MNKKSRQQAKSNIEKDFYKLLNNSNFLISVATAEAISKTACSSLFSTKSANSLL